MIIFPDTIGNIDEDCNVFMILWWVYEDNQQAMGIWYKQEL